MERHPSFSLKKGKRKQATFRGLMGQHAAKRVCAGRLTRPASRGPLHGGLSALCGRWWISSGLKTRVQLRGGAFWDEMWDP